MTRAAVSIASNIAEGAERDSIAEFIRFLHIAKGSAAELRTQVYIAQRIGVLPSANAQTTHRRTQRDLSHAPRPYQILKTQILTLNHLTLKTLSCLTS